MKIVKLQAENFKRLRAVVIEPDPDGNMVVISGKNGAGKTSVMDAMWHALGGRAATADTPRPIRDGEESATVTLDLGDLIVTRSWKASGSTLKVTARDGATYSSPQKILDGLTGKMGFDPLAFSRLAAKDQLAQLLELVDLPFEPEALAIRRRMIFDARTDVNRELKAAEARLAAAPDVPDDTPAEEVSATTVLAELEAARLVVTENERKRGVLTDYREDHHDARAALEEAVDALALAERAVVDAQRALDSAASRLAKGEEICSVLVDPDLSVFHERLTKLEQTNTLVRAARDREFLRGEVNEHHTSAEDLTRQLADLDAEKANALASATMPIDGLGFDDDGVTYGGIPFAQCSAAEQLRVSVAIAMAANPDVRVIRIVDGSLLDSDSLRLIGEMAAEHDYQVWIEMVDETGERGVVIEDGLVGGAVWVGDREVVA